MNQIIVILLIIRNLLKPFKGSLIQMVLCLCGLAISFYVYKVYNTIQKQVLSINVEQSHFQNIKTLSLGVIIDYGDSEDSPYRSLFTDSIIGTTILFSQTFYLDSINQSECVTSEEIVDLISSSNFDNEIINSFQSANQYVYVSAVVDYQENNWIFPHFGHSIRETIDKPEIAKHNFASHNITLSQVQEIQWSDINLNSNKKKPFISFDRRIKYYLFEYLMATNDTLFATFDNITTEKRYYAPHYYSSYDVSKLEMILNFNLDTLTSLNITTLPLAEFNDLYPSPDFKNSQMVFYSDPIKLETIKENGLKLFLKLPKTESLQQTRNYIISALITIFLTLFLTQFYYLCKKIYCKRRRKVFRYNQIFKRYPQKGIQICKALFPYTLCVYLCIGFFIILINPYDWNWIDDLAFLCGMISLTLSIHYNRLLRYRAVSDCTDNLKQKNCKYVRNIALISLTSYFVGILLVIVNILNNS